MTRVVLILAVSLAQAPPSDPKPKPQQPATPSAADEAEYLARKAKVLDTADARMKLALWCESKGLKEQADAQFEAVVALDPKRDNAWKHLGYKKHRGKWMTDEQIADEAEQIKADRKWLPILKKLHDGLHDKKPAKREEARAAFLKLDDPRAAPALWVALAAGGAKEQQLALTVYGGMKGASATKALAMLAISGKSDEVRRVATETLRDREAAEYGGLLVALIRKPMRYEVKPVDGPGSAGVLLVEGAKRDTRRIYAPPVAPETKMLPGDIVTPDEDGLPQISRGGGQFTAVIVDEQGNPVDTVGMQKIKVGRNAVEAQRAAMMAQAQLEKDVAAIESVNRSILTSNDRAIAVLKVASGQDRGDDPIAWRAWLAEVEGKSASIALGGKSKRKKVNDSFVCLAYQPEFSVAQPVVTIAVGTGSGISHAAPS